MESTEILEVEPLCMIPPEEPPPNSGDLSDFDSPKVSASPGNSANWLPPGWTIETRIKSSGLKYKVYKDPHTGRKFYSRIKVLDYLQNPTPREPNKRIRSRRANITSSQGHNWLPPDWVVQIKMKMNGTTAGTKYKVYIEKSTGKKFYSQSQVLDYLKPYSSSSPDIENVQSVRSENLPEWFPQGQSMQAEIKTNHNISTDERKNKVKDTEIEEKNVEGLPLGWFKAIKYRESKAGIHYKTALYVDPISGYAFFSMMDALRYIDNGHIKDCRMKPTFWSKISKNSAGNKFHSQPTYRERELKPEKIKRKRPLYTEESDEGISNEDVIQMDDSDGQRETKTKERLKRKLCFSEENFGKKSDDEVETNDLPMAASDTAEKGKEKMTERPPLKRSRIKVLASKRRPYPRSSILTSSQTRTSDPSSVCPVQTDLKSNEENPESEQIKVSDEGSSQQIDLQAIKSDGTKASSSAFFGKPSLDPCLKFAFKTLTEDI